MYLWLNTAIFEKKLSQFGSKEDMPQRAREWLSVSDGAEIRQNPGIRQPLFFLPCGACPTV